jgi:tellurite resistance protein
MSNLINTLREQLKDQLARRRNLPLLKAAMAASAIVAMADGSVSFGQRVRIDQILQTLEALRIFDPHEGVNLFNDFAEAILDSPQAGRAEAMKAITAAAQDAETAALLIRIALAVSSSRREMALVERIELMSLCNRLGVEPDSCGLGADLV